MGRPKIYQDPKEKHRTYRQRQREKLAQLLTRPVRPRRAPTPKPRPPAGPIHPGVTIMQGDALTVLRTLPAESVHCVVTSPPYWGLRDYGTATWIGGDPACDHVAETKPAVIGSSSTLGFPAGGGEAADRGGQYLP